MILCVALNTANSHLTVKHAYRSGILSGPNSLLLSHVQSNHNIQNLNIGHFRKDDKVPVFH